MVNTSWKDTKGKKDRWRGLADAGGQLPSCVRGDRGRRRLGREVRLPSPNLDHGVILIRLLPRVICGALVLQQPESVFISMALAAVEGLADTCGLGCLLGLRSCL